MGKSTEKKCSFCGRKESEVEVLLYGIDGAICESCVDRAKKMPRKTVSV